MKFPGRFRRRRIILVMIPLLVAPIVAFRAAVMWMPYAPPDHAPPASTLLLDRHGQPLFASVAFDGQWRIPLRDDEINPDLANAIIAVEDARFYQHGGVDWRSMIGAAIEDVRHASIRRGASTLTMQLARLREP